MNEPWQLRAVRKQQQWQSKHPVQWWLYCRLPRAIRLRVWK